MTAPMTNLPPVQELSEEKLAEMLAAAEKATPGEWRADNTGLYVWATSLKGGDFPLADGGGHDALVARMRGWGYYTGNGAGGLGLTADEAVSLTRQDLKHIANCGPDTIRALVTELQHSRAAEAVAPDGWVLLPRDIAIRARNAAESYISNPEVRDSLVRELNERISAPSPATGVRVRPDRDSIRIAQQFADMFRSGAQGAGIDCDAAMSLALALDDILSALAGQP